MSFSKRQAVLPSLFSETGEPKNSQKINSIFYHNTTHFATPQLREKLLPKQAVFLPVGIRLSASASKKHPHRSCSRTVHPHLAFPFRRPAGKIEKRRSLDQTAPKSSVLTGSPARTVLDPAGQTMPHAIHFKNQVDHAHDTQGLFRTDKEFFFAFHGSQNIGIKG